MPLNIQDVVIKLHRAGVPLDHIIAVNAAIVTVRDKLRSDEAFATEFKEYIGTEFTDILANAVNK